MDGFWTVLSALRGEASPRRHRVVELTLYCILVQTAFTWV